MRIVSLLPAALLLFASYWALRLAWADHLSRTGSESGLRRAIELAPFHPGYQVKAGNLRQAILINPLLSSAWMELGLEAEAAEDFADAERCLLQAAEVDHMFEPRWTLANFYFRRERDEEFWKWLRLAAERSYGDRIGLLRLAWWRTQDPREILDRALPRERTLLAAFAGFLLRQEQTAKAFPVVEALLPLAVPDDKALLLDICDRWIKSGQRQEAVTLWNGLIARGLLSATALSPERDLLLGNAALAVEPAGKGFDWKLSWRVGVQNIYSKGQRQIRSLLNGRQEERTELLTIVAPVTPKERHQFEFRYRTEGLAEKSGVFWRVEDAVTGREIEGMPRIPLSSGSWRDQKLEFLPNGSLARLTLACERVPGAMRQEGAVILDGAFRLARKR